MRPPSEWPSRTTGLPLAASRTAAEPPLHVVEVVRPAVHVGAPAARPTVAPQVERPDLDAGRGEPVAHVLVASAVLGDAVDDEHRGPGRPDGRPVANQQLGRAALPPDGLGRGRHGGPPGERSVSAAKGSGWDGRDPCQSRRPLPSAPCPSGTRSPIASGCAATGSTTRRSGWSAATTGCSSSTRGRRIARARSCGRTSPSFPGAVRWVVNTHHHHDHCYGNHVFRDTEIWAQTLLPDPARGAHRRRCSRSSCTTCPTRPTNGARSSSLRPPGRSTSGPRSRWAGGPWSCATSAAATPTTTSS